jgi:hypothetical protein
MATAVIIDDYSNRQTIPKTVDYPLTQITKNREYFITKSKGDDKYTLTFVDDKVKKYLDTIEAAKQLAENNFINFYYK